MPVYGEKTLTSLQETVGQIGLQFFAMNPLDLTTDEFADAFIRPEDLPILRYAAKLLRVDSGHQVMKYATRNGLPMLLRRQGNPKSMLFPDYTRSDGAQPTASSEVLDKIDTWVQARSNQGCMFGLVIDALKYFNERLSYQVDLATLLPCMPSILSKTDKMEKRAEKIAGKHRTTGLPMLPLGVKQQLSDACALVNMAVMTIGAPPALPPETLRLIYYRNEQPIPGNMFRPGRASFV